MPSEVAPIALDGIRLELVFLEGGEPPGDILPEGRAFAFRVDLLPWRLIALDPVEEPVLNVDAHDVVVQLVNGIAIRPLVDGIAILIDADFYTLFVTFCHIRNSFHFGFQNARRIRFVVFKERSQRGALLHQLSKIIEGFRGNVNLGLSSWGPFHCVIYRFLSIFFDWDE